MSDGDWKVLPYDAGADKTIQLEGPSDGFYPQMIYVDFDDVEHDEIERRVPLVVAALNAVDWTIPEQKEREES
jgi:hypothetical protein